MIYLNENGGRQEIWIPLKGKANGYNGATAPLYQEITENGEYVWERSNGYSPVTVKVDVPQTTKVDVGALGIKLSYSTFTEVPDVFDFSNCTDMSDMFYNCFYLITIPQMDTSKMMCMDSMFHDCYSLTSIPQIDTSNVLSMYYTFTYCMNLTTIPQFDTSKVTRMTCMFENCQHLVTIPQLDTSKCTDMHRMFERCLCLTTVPAMDTSKVTDMYNMFRECSKLTTVQQLDFSNCTNISLIFFQCSSLTSLTLAGSINTDLKLTDSPLNEESIKSVLTAASKTTNTTAKTLTFKEGSTLKDTDGVWAALISECTGKGWSINNLTLV